MLVGQLVRFMLVGVVNTGVGLSAILLLRFGVGASDVVANVCGYAIGILVSFVLNRRFTFADRSAIAPAFVRFLISAGVAYLVNLAVLLLLLNVVGAGSLISQVTAVVAYSIAFFALSKVFAFSGAHEVAPTHALPIGRADRVQQPSNGLS